jgi:hypothetical protein
MALALLSLSIVGSTTVAALAAHPLILHNKTSSKIVEVYVSHVSEANWGENFAKGDPVAPGDSMTLEIPEDDVCMYDIKVVFADGSSVISPNHDTCKFDVDFS